MSPIYEFSCSDCARHFTMFESIKTFESKEFRALCSNCGSNKAKKLIAKTDFVLKGGNWANNSYGLGRKSRDTKKLEGKNKDE